MLFGIFNHSTDCLIPQLLNFEGVQDFNFMSEHTNLVFHRRGKPPTQAVCVIFINAGKKANPQKHPQKVEYADASSEHY